MRVTLILSILILSTSSMLCAQINTTKKDSISNTNRSISTNNNKLSPFENTLNGFHTINNEVLFSDIVNDSKDGRIISGQHHMPTVFANPSYKSIAIESNFNNSYLYLINASDSRSFNSIIDYKLYSVPDLNIHMTYIDYNKERRYRNMFKDNSHWVNHVIGLISILTD